MAGYGSYLKAARAEEAPAAVFKAFNSFQILCALRDGPFGVLGLNERLELALSRAGLIARDGDWYAGRPVMVVRNDHGVGLYNGDMGPACLMKAGGSRYGLSSRTAHCGPCCPAACRPTRRSMP